MGERHKGKIQPNEIVTRELFKEFAKRLRLVNEEQRIEVAKAVIGMVLTQLGIGLRMWFDPVAVPSTYKKKRGRPPKVK